MIRLYDIQQAFAGLVGWEQSYNPADQIAEELTESESGLTFQGAHPLVTLANIRAIMPEDWELQYPDYVAGANYYKGDKVKYQNALWIATAFSTGEAPAFDSMYWMPYSGLSDYLQRLTTNGINTMVQTFLQEKQLLQETKSLVERRTFFDGAARLQAEIAPKGRLVGFEIVPVRAMGVTTKIERIGLQMVGAVGTVKLYVFHSSQYAPAQVVELNFTNTNGGFQWFNLASPLYLPYVWPRFDGDSDVGNDAGGAWFICYNQDELPDGMRALNVSKDWSVEPCQACLGGSIEGWKQITKYMQVSPFSTRVPEGWEDEPRMFDIGQLNYTNTMNYGINCEVSVGCDLTDFIISQRNIFATVLQKQVAVSVLRTLAMNPDVRVNRNQANATRDEILYEVDGVPQGRASGLGYELRQAYKALELDTRGLDRICLQCNNHGVKYRTV